MVRYSSIPPKIGHKPEKKLSGGAIHPLCPNGSLAGIPSGNPAAKAKYPWYIATDYISMIFARVDGNAADGTLTIS